VRGQSQRPLFQSRQLHSERGEDPSGREGFFFNSGRSANQHREFQIPDLQLRDQNRGNLISHLPGLLL